MPHTTVTLADLKVSLEQRWDGEAFWTEEEARLALNEALRDWNLLVGQWRRRLTLSTAAANPELSLGATMTYGMRVAMATGTPLIPTSTLELDLGRPTWRRETTASGGAVPTVPTLWAPQSLQQLVIWPATVGAGTNNLLVDGVSNTPVLTEDGDTVDLDDALIDTLTDFALHCAAFKEGGPRWRATRPYFQTFLQAAAEQNGLLKRNQAFRRWAGIDRRRDLQPAKAAPTQLDGAAQAAGPQGGGFGG